MSAADRKRLGQRKSNRATIRDVARAAGVSIATVSNTITGSRVVSRDLALKVQQAATELGYTPDRAASALRRAQSRLVGLIIPDFTNPFFAEMVASVEELASESGYDLVVASSRESAAGEATQVRAMLDRRACGLLIVPTDDRFEASATISDNDLPVVILDRNVPNNSYDSVTVNNADVAHAAVEGLYELGHARILVVASSMQIINVRERVDGALAAARKHGIEKDLEVIEAGRHADDVAAQLTARLSRDPRPTAIFALNNMAALGALQAIKALELDVPGEISLISFDDYEWMRVLRPTITAVRQPVDAMARAAWRMLLEQLAGSTDRAGELRLSCAISWRESTAPPKQSYAEATGSART